MTRDEFDTLSRQLLLLPAAASMQSKSHAVLLDAMLGAGFKWLRSVPATLQGTAAEPVLQGGFVVRDPATGAEYELAVVVRSIEDSLILTVGFCHYWEVSAIRGRKAARRQGAVPRVLVVPVRKRVLFPEELERHDAASVTDFFSRVFDSVLFMATPTQANAFANRLSDALAP